MAISSQKLDKLNKELIREQMFEIRRKLMLIESDDGCNKPESENHLYRDLKKWYNILNKKLQKNKHRRK